MNALIIISSAIACAVIGVPTVIVFLNNRKLQALRLKRYEQQVKAKDALEKAKIVEDIYAPYEQALDSLQDQKSRSLDSDQTIQSLQSRIAVVVTEKEFQTVNTQIQTLQGQIEESKKKEMDLFKQAKPIMDRLEAERRRQQEIERKAQQKRDEEARIARKKREDEEEEERQARRRRDEASAASSYSSYSSSSSSDSSSSWSGGGGDSSGGGSSDSW